MQYLGVMIFEGHKITELTYNGRQAWLAYEVGIALGYSHEGKAFPGQLRTTWSAEVDDEDCILVRHSEFKDFEGMVNLPSKCRSVLVIFEDALNIGLIKTRKPAGAKLRRLLAKRIMPQILRDGKFIPERSVDGGVIISDAVPDGPVESAGTTEWDVGMARESRLVIRDAQMHEVLIMKERRLARSDDVSLLFNVLNAKLRSGDISPKEYASKLEDVVGPALGVDFNCVKAASIESELWMSPSEIGRRLRVTPNLVGRMITKAKLVRGGPHSRPCKKAATNSKTGKEVDCWEWDQYAVGKIGEFVEKMAPIKIVEGK